MVSSSLPARNPPCTFPAGFRNSALASNFVSIVPRSPSIWTNARPRIFAQGGGGIRPSAIFQKNEFLSTMLLSLLRMIGLLADHVQPHQHLLHRRDRGV